MTTATIVGRPSRLEGLGAGDMTKIAKRLPDDYGHLLAEVKNALRSAQYEALRAVNRR